jgi:hypothetical protein
MRRLLIAGLLAASLSLGFGAAATAAPIFCPPPQVATHFGGGAWECVNGGGNQSGAAETKNPTD